MHHEQEDMNLEAITCAMSRRELLASCGKATIVVKAMAFTGLGLGSFLTGCADSDPAEYYIVRKHKLLKGLDKEMGYTKELYVSRFGDKLADTIGIEIRREYEHLLPQLPYIGGTRNFMTRILVACAGYLAIYKVLKGRGMPTEEIGRFIYDTSEVWFNKYPAAILHLVGKFGFTRFSIEGMKRAATESQRRLYPGNWVYTAIEGNGQEFDYGMDFTECAICKLYHAHRADEITPYVCSLDYITSEAFGQGAMRTMTLAEGAEKCDFRYKKGGPTRIKVGWRNHE